MTHTEPVLAQLTLAQATALAREGRYAEADALLVHPAMEAEAAAALDLRARIHSQQGRLAEAADCWRQLLARDPGHQAAAAGLRRVEAIQGGRRHRPLLVPGALAVVLVALVVAVIAMIRWPPADGEAAGAISGPPPGTPGEAAPPAASPPEPAPPAIALSGETLRVATRGPDLVVTFDEPLFGHGAGLSPASRERLRALGRQLDPHATRVTIAVTGLTDAVPLRRESRYRDNTALAFARAGAVADAIRQGGSALSAHTFTLHAQPADASEASSMDNGRTARITLAQRRDTAERTDTAQRSDAAPRGEASR